MVKQFTLTVNVVKIGSSRVEELRMLNRSEVELLRTGNFNIHT